MSSIFSTYLQLGFTHISDLKGYDHILFIVALCAVYHPTQWKRVVLLATAFTIGHSITLALAALNLIPVNTRWVEFLIPVTILLTALFNVSTKKKSEHSFSKWHYALPLVFGLIHGMGFSNFLKAMLLPGEENQLVLQLLAFNIGVELGQLVIVSGVMLLAYAVLRLLNTKLYDWNLFVSGASFGLALVMALERI
ncbi:MAG TPA: HupE/UreJ family protein [Saprospiraceae bacterium]|nr:HupE/UreJ family protein [Saprospiraceae bacterium]HMQ83583.1 HupE/UreJ family protein [Saprospiraceae bacterium]